VDESDWGVALTEWHLCGPRLVSFLVCLALSLRVSRRKIQGFLRDWLGIDLSTGTINQCIHEAGRAVAPVVDGQLVAELKAGDLLHIDESVPRRRAQKVKVLQCSSAAQEMRVGPSESPYRRRLQTPYCCCV